MKQRGFTLIEMLVVIAIAALIIAITLGIARGAIKMVRSFQGMNATPNSAAARLA